MRIAALIVAAGSSRRMGFDKLEADLAGRSVLAWSIAALSACDEIGTIRVVTSRDKFAMVDRLGAEHAGEKFVECVEGGAERHLSVAKGLAAIEKEAGWIAVHDGARPLVSPDSIAVCARAASETGAAALAHRVADTLKRGNERLEAAESVSRENLWGMETPQIFSASLLREAYAAILASGQLVTDEVSAVQAAGHPVRLVENREVNTKITVPGDIVVARAILMARRGNA